MNQISHPSDLLLLITQARAVIADAAADDGSDQADSEATVRLLRQLGQLLAAHELYLQVTGGDGSPLEPDLTTREQQFALLDQAVAALRSGRHLVSARRAIGARALDPIDQHAEFVVKLALEAANGIAPGPVSGPERTRLQPPSKPFVDGGRSVVVVADGSELARTTAVLLTWARSFRPADDATLAILVSGPDPAHHQTALLGALASAGIDADTELDLAIHARSLTSEAALARSAHAVLSDLPDWSGPLSALPRLTTGEADRARLTAIAQARWDREPVGRRLRFALKIPPRDWTDALGWGDTFFALQFARELERRGHTARLDLLPEWDLLPALRQEPADDVVIHLRGPFPYVPQPDSFNVLWNISRPSRVTAPECDAFDLIAAPSSRRAEELQMITSTPVMVLPQATDPTNCWPEPDPSFAHELTFVANTRGVHRPIIRDLLPTAHDLAVWGKGWEGLIPDRYLVGESLDNDLLRRAYSSAAIVLNDHMEDQRAHGIVNNRIYDVLACGGCVLSDHLPELDDEFREIVATYRNPEALQATVARLLADPAERAERATRGRDLVLREHTFAHRADALLRSIASQLTTSPG